MATITDAQLTQATLDGQGIFDLLMRANAAHLDAEFQKNRIKGNDYAQVYLSSTQSAMQYAIQFLLEKQRADKQAELLAAQVVTEEKQQALLVQQELNAVTENTVLVAQECKLRAEYDLIMEQKLKTVAETALLNQKKATEKAQTLSTGVDPDSIIGRQKGLYKAQTDGYVRDAEQKAAKVLAETWSVRRTTDEGTQANSTNRLDDASVGRAINKLLGGVNA